MEQGHYNALGSLRLGPDELGSLARMRMRKSNSVRLYACWIEDGHVYFSSAASQRAIVTEVRHPERIVGYYSRRSTPEVIAEDIRFSSMERAA